MFGRFTTQGSGRPFWWAAFAVFVALGIWLLWHNSAEAPTSQDIKSAASLEVSLPKRIVVPRARIDAPFTSPLGILESGEVEVPAGYEEVGYYKYGPTPGEIGPAVVLGHVDSFAGPAVFYSLGALEPGDEIFIEREDGSTAVFSVERLERHLQAGFPTKEVYGDLSYPGLRLITCSGVYDNGQARYSHNLIVFARLKEVR